MQKYVNLLDLVKIFLTSIYLQAAASIQPRTSLLKLGGDSIHFFIPLLILKMRSRAQWPGGACAWRFARDRDRGIPVDHEKLLLSNYAPSEWLYCNCLKIMLAKSNRLTTPLRSCHDVLLTFPAWWSIVARNGRASSWGTLLMKSCISDHSQIFRRM